MSVRWLDGPGGGDGHLLWVADRRDPRVPGWLRAAAPTPADLADFAHRPDAADRLARRALARLLVARACGVHPATVAFGREPAGRPLLRHPPGRHLALAGRGDLLLVALGPRPFGADVEPATSDPPPRHLLSPAEAATLRALPPAAAATAWTRWWAAKEAHAKRLGHPRAIAPEAVAVGPDEARGPGDARSALHFHAGPDWIACAAVEAVAGEG